MILLKQVISLCWGHHSSWVSMQRCTQKRLWAALVVTAPYSPFTCAKEPFLVLCASSRHICAGLGALTRASTRGHRGKADAAPWVPSTNKDKSTVRSLLTAFSPNHCMLPYDSSSWSKLPEVPCCLVLSSSSLLLLPSTTPLWGPLCKCSGHRQACSQMESCPGVEMALEEGAGLSSHSILSPDPCRGGHKLEHVCIHLCFCTPAVWLTRSWPRALSWLLPEGVALESMRN